MRKSLVQLLKEADGNESEDILSKLPKALDSKQSATKLSFKNTKGEDRPVPAVRVYSKNFGEQGFKQEFTYPIDPEVVHRHEGSGMGNVLRDPLEEEIDDIYVSGVLEQLKYVTKRYGVNKIKAVGNGKNYVSTEPVDSYRDYTPEEALEAGVSLDSKEKYAIYRFEILGLKDNELLFVKERLKESGLLSESVSEKQRLMKLAGVVSESAETLEDVDYDEGNWEDAEPSEKNKDSKTSIKEFREVVRKLIKEELNRKFSKNK
jgi:hypothetical protein